MFNMMVGFMLRGIMAFGCMAHGELQLGSDVCAAWDGVDVRLAPSLAEYDAAGEADDTECGEPDVVGCETTQNLDGRWVTVCAGRVMVVTDGKGNGWERLSDESIHVRSDDGKDIKL